MPDDVGEKESPWESRGRTETGGLEEQTIELIGPDGSKLTVRRIRLTLGACPSIRFDRNSNSSKELREKIGRESR